MQGLGVGVCRVQGLGVQGFWRRAFALYGPGSRELGVASFRFER